MDIPEIIKTALVDSTVIRDVIEAGRRLNIIVYLVGGALRDILLNAGQGRDYDFIVDGDSHRFAAEFAVHSGYSLFPLDEERHTYRVVIPGGYHADFSAIQGDIHADLGMRDFTINSIALLVSSLSEKIPLLIDPLDGVGDIRKKILRVSYPSSFSDDPVRILRGLRFVSRFNMDMSQELASLMTEHRASLKDVPAERLRAELFMILEWSDSYESLRLMDKTGVLSVLFPEMDTWKDYHQGGRHIYDLFDHSLNTLKAVDEILKNLNRYFPEHEQEILTHFEERIEEHITRKGLLKLCSLLHDAGKISTGRYENGRMRFINHEKAGALVNMEIAGRFKLSRKSEHIIKLLSENHMRILGLSMLNRITSRAKYRFLRDTYGSGLDLILLAVADATATSSKPASADLLRVVRSIIAYNFEEFKTLPDKPLLTGREIMHEFGISEGVMVGNMLDMLKEAETMGTISDKSGAVNFLRCRFRH